MSMDPGMMGAPADAGPPEAEEPAEASKPAGQKRFAQAIAALELASGSPEAMTAADGADEFSVAFSGDDAVVTVGDIEVAVSADQIGAEVDEEMTEIEDMPDPEGAA